MAIDSIRPSALDALVNHALSAPSVVVGRALYRHWNGAVGEHGYAHALEAAWSGLRNYLDQRWFFTALRRKTETYPDVIRRAIIEGNLRVRTLKSESSVAWHPLLWFRKRRLVACVVQRNTEKQR